MCSWRRRCSYRLRAFLTRIVRKPSSANMSKKVDVRLPAVDARTHALKLDRHSWAAPVEDLRVASVLPGKKPLAPVPNENKQPASRTMTLLGASKKEEGSSVLSFTAGDMCAQLDVLARPMYLCDSLASKPKSNAKGSADPVGAASTKHSQPSQALAASALARLGSASRSTSAAASNVKGWGDAGSGRSSRIQCTPDAYSLNKLFALENDIGLSSIDDEGGKLVASDAELAVSTSVAEVAATADKFMGGVASALSTAMLECDAEVLDVWVDESDGTTGSSNSTGLAARDLLHLSSLAHDCTKGSCSMRRHSCWCSI